MNNFKKMKSVILVSCVSKKEKTRSPAKYLYTSHWFKSARRLAEDTGVPWYILSAEYGLLHPDTVIGTYDKTLNTMGAADRRAWSQKVQGQMEKELPEANKVIILAGEKYRKYLMSWLKSRFAEVSVPMEGLRIGQQLGWLNRATTL